VTFTLQHYLKLAVDGGSPQASGILAYETLLDHGEQLMPEDIKKVKVTYDFLC
jgi:hypothetical protein